MSLCYCINKKTGEYDLITVEEDPIFTAWLTNPGGPLPPGSETDPIFTAWLSGPPNVSIFTNDAGYITSRGPETDPIFNAWLIATPPLYSFTELDPVFNAWLLTNPFAGYQPIGTAWLLNGNTVVVKKTLGTLDNFDLGIITNSLERITVKNTGKVWVADLSNVIEKIITVGNVGAVGELEDDLQTDIAFITNATIITALLLETNRILETYSGTTVGAVEGQEYIGPRYRYLYQNSIFTRYPISTNANYGKTQATIAASAALNTVGTLISIGLPIPMNTLVAGSTFDIHIFGTCTSSNADVSTFTGRIGPLNTVADGALFTKTLTSAGSGTNIPFSLTIRFTVRTIGATGTIYGHTQLMNEGTTGIYTAVTQTGALSSVSNFSSIVDNFLNISYISAANTTTCTFQNVVLEQLK